MNSSKDELFINESLEFFTRTRLNYRGLCRLLLFGVIHLELKPNQMRQLMDLACRYYLLFWSDGKQIAT